MLLGLHTYSLYLHGIGQDWAGFSLPWPRQMDVWQLMDYGVKLGLEGLHIDDGAFDSLDKAYLNKVGSRAKELDLYLEYNFSLDSSDYDPSLQHSVEEGVQIAQALGADIAKISMDLKRPRPMAASKFHPVIMEQLAALVKEVAQAAPMAEKAHGRLFRRSDLGIGSSGPSFCRRLCRYGQWPACHGGPHVGH